ncbi:hypothetical protein F4779DRAFT_572640 [Xylariaceae sp. FL0662B]|nr:hypothetical protein F4779DRAFT_572640 [Xylariaceae sp. FL0662B]
MALRRCVAAASLASMFALSIANPVPELTGLKAFEKRKDERAECAVELDGSRTRRIQVWGSDTLDGYGVGKFLDKWVKKHGEKDWINRMDKDLYSTGTSKFWCNSLGGSQCPDPDSCSAYMDRKVVQLYWILTAAKNHYEIFNHMNDWLQTKTIEDTLAIPDITEKFGKQGDKNSDLWGKLIGALVTGAGLAAPAPGGALLSPLLTVGVGGANIASGFAAKEIDYTKAVSDQLGEAFKALTEGLRSHLNIAMTGSDSKSGKKSKDLPGLSGKYQTNIAKYFSDGRWLVTNIEKETQPVLDKFGQYLKQGTVIAILKARKFFIYINSDLKKDDCKSDTQVWLDDGCAELWSLADTSKEHAIADGAKEDEAKAMKESKYGSFDLKKAFENAIKCARAHPDGKGKIDVKKLPKDGAMAECFIDLPVFKGSKKKHYGKWELHKIDKDYINSTPYKGYDD